MRKQRSTESRPVEAYSYRDLDFNNRHLDVMLGSNESLLMFPLKISETCFSFSVAH